MCILFAVRNYTTHEVISAYRKSCEKYNTKPMYKIIQQIEVSRQYVYYYTFKLLKCHSRVLI